MVRVGQRVFGLWLAGSLLVIACTPQLSGSSVQPQGSTQVAASKRVVVGITADAYTLSRQLSGGLAGIEGLELLVHAGLGTWDDPRGGIQPKLAEAIPSLENGLWKTFPDSRMETTWRIRNGVEWHDGTPLTSDDLLFTATVHQDREVGVFRTPIYDAVQDVAAVDLRTITVRWKQIYIDADNLFGAWNTAIQPKHLLEGAHATDKAGYKDLPYWTDEFVGLGPYRVVDWERGSHTTLRANGRYALGRPKIDEIIVRFIPDLNAFTANLMAGAIDVTLGTTISLDQGEAIRKQREMTLDFTLDGFWRVLFAQHIDPNPPAVADLRFRTALLNGIDRQGLIDSFLPGLTQVAHSIITPVHPDFPAVANQVVKYEYDPRKAAQLLEGLGFRRGPEGALYDQEGRKLSVEIRTSSVDLNQKSTLAVANNWEALGVTVTPVVPAAAQSGNRQYSATYPAFSVQGQAAEVTGIRNLVTSQVPLPANDFRGNNRSRYINPEFDALIDRFQTTVPRAERLMALGQVVRHVSENLPVMGLFYSGTITVFDPRLQNVSGGARGNSTWNVHEWDLRAG